MLPFIVVILVASSRFVSFPFPLSYTIKELVEFRVMEQEPGLLTPKP
jgi:hypothetical protein